MMDVISTEGVSGLYRGLSSTLFTLFFANFIYFYAFHLMRAFVSRNPRIRRIGKVIRRILPVAAMVALCIRPHNIYATSRWKMLRGLFTCTL